MLFDAVVLVLESKHLRSPEHWIEFALDAPASSKAVAPMKTSRGEADEGRLTLSVVSRNVPEGKVIFGTKRVENAKGWGA